MHLRSRGRRITVAALTAAVLTGTTLPAWAAITPTAPEPGPAPVTAQPATLTALPSSQWQTNAAVWALAVSNGKLFAGGEFTSVRPPTAALGTGEVAAGRIAAFDAATGTYDSSFKHTLDGRVLALAVSPDKRTLYLGGEFSYVDGKARSKVAALDLTRPGAPLLAWNPNMGGGAVRALAVAADSGSVFIGGAFTTVGGASRPVLAQVRTDGTQVTTFAPNVDGPVNALLVAPGGGRLVLGGNFENVNSAHHRALASVEISNGSNAPMADAITSCGKGCGSRSDIKALVTDGTLVYAGAEGTGGGWFDGTMAVNPATGAVAWKDNCLGATQSVAVVAGVLYVGSHAHDCTASGGFGQAPNQSGPSSWNHLRAERADNGAGLDWYPTTNPGPTEAKQPNELGPRAMATDGTNLWVAGQFTRVNNAGQQGLTRFMADTPRAKPLAVTNALASTMGDGRTELRFNGTSDPDSGALTYRIFRNSNLTTPVGTIGPVAAHWWQTPLYAFRESGLSPTGKYSYTIETVDEAGNTARSVAFGSNTVSKGYEASVKASTPSQYWRLDETSGTTAADSSGQGVAGTYSGPMNLNAPGSVPSGPSVHLSGSATITPADNVRAVPGPTTYTAESWIRTTTRTGGRIFGFGNRASGTSGSYDRMLYMNNSGQLLFGVYTGSTQTLWSPKSYNDGTWHHVAVTQDATNGIRLWVDGQLVAFNKSVTTAQNYNGYWRMGADNTNGWPQRPTSAGFTGDVDEFAVYSTSLPSATLRQHVAAE